MVKKKTVGTKKPRKVASGVQLPLIDKALRKRTKADIIGLILKLAKKHAILARDLEKELAIEKPMTLLVDEVSSAITRATDFDEGEIGYNFNVDWRAYEDVGRGLKKLIKHGQLEDAKSLALKLMKDGSCQVECSDEGLMSDDLEDCLRPVIQAVQSTDDKGAANWASEMLQADRVGFICDQELKSLEGRSS